jgi:hypothetical protein
MKTRHSDVAYVLITVNCPLALAQGSNRRTLHITTLQCPKQHTNYYRTEATATCLMLLIAKQVHLRHRCTHMTHRLCV